MDGGTVSYVRVSNVGFSYGRRAVLHDLSFRLDVGLYGLLGPNGAGKTTLMNLIATLERPSGGTITFGGEEVADRGGRRAARSRLGYLPQRFELMDSSSLLRNVRYAAWAHGMSYRRAGMAAERAIRVVGLSGMERRRVRSLSGGMRQRAGIACALVTEPDVLLLDEPTVGLDPLQRIDIRKFLGDYARHHTVLISTHLVDDLALIADQVIVMDAGRIIMQGGMDDLADLGRGSSDPLASAWELGYETLMGSRHAGAAGKGGADHGQ